MRRKSDTVFLSKFDPPAEEKMKDNCEHTPPNGVGKCKACLHKEQGALVKSVQDAIEQTLKDKMGMPPGFGMVWPKPPTGPIEWPIKSTPYMKSLDDDYQFEVPKEDSPIDYEGIHDDIEALDLIRTSEARGELFITCAAVPYFVDPETDIDLERYPMPGGFGWSDPALDSRWTPQLFAAVSRVLHNLGGSDGR